MTVSTHATFGAQLTTRESDTLNLLSKGFSVVEIGRALHLAPSTARTHIRCCYRKLGARNAAHAVAIAAKLGFLGVTGGVGERVLDAAVVEIQRLRAAHVQGVVTRRAGGGLPSDPVVAAWRTEAVHRWNEARPALCALVRAQQHTKAVAS